MSAPRLRLGVLGIVVISLFSMLFARLWYLQVMAAPDFEEKVTTSLVRLVMVPAPRGRILDRQGRVLVDNRVSNIITVNRALVDAKERDAVLGRLSALLGTPVKDLEHRLKDKRYSPYRPVPMAEDVNKDKIIYVKEHQDLFPGVDATRVTERVYPNGVLAAHLLGYVGEINAQELAARRHEGLRLGDDVGKTGVESVYDRYLRGTPGVVKLEVDARGKVLRTLGEQEPVQGDDVVLTLDRDVQKVAEDSLQLGLETARHATDRTGNGKPFTAPAGAVVVLDPRDGSVVALVSNPTYDPATFLRPVPAAEYAAKFQDPATHFPLNDRATQGLYAPGSTFKLVTALASLRAGIITPRTTVDDKGTFRIPSCTGKCTFHNAGGHQYGRVNVTRAITVSSDVFFYSLGSGLFAQRSNIGNALHDTGEQLGFGVRSGIPLRPEYIGRVPDPETRAREHKEHPQAFREGRWFPGDELNVAIGQGETVATPLQLANAYATFANGGTLYAPRIASVAKNRDGKPTATFAPSVQHRIALPPEIHDPIMAGLIGAVNDPHGTAYGAFAGFSTPAFRVAGKTGTAQVRNKQDTALFVAVAPADAPRYVVSVVLEEAGFGGEAAAPVARRILQGAVGQAPGDVSRQGAVD